MKVFMIGGTGLLGCAAAQMFIDKGYEVASIALPPLPVGAPIPKEMDLKWGNYLEMSDEELMEMQSDLNVIISHLSEDYDFAVGEKIRAERILELNTNHRVFTTLKAIY